MHVFIADIQVAWYKNDSLIKPSRFFRMASERDCFTLTISEAFPEDEGTYKCVATNSAGSVASSAALKLVGPAASVEMYQPQAQIVHEPNEARPPLSKKQLLHQQQLQQQRALHQQRLQQQQQAQQQIQQQQAKVQSQANVQFNPIAPQITPLVAQTAGVGKTVRFETKVSGQPWPTLSWFKDGVALTTDSRISFGSTNSESGCLQIVQVQLGDSGMYTLCAENEGGRSKSTAQLLVVEDEQLLQNAVITTTSKGHDGQQVTQRKQQQLPITAPASTGATSGRSSDRTPSPGKKSGDDKKRKQAKKKSKADKSDRSE